MNEKPIVTKSDITSCCRAAIKPGQYILLPESNRVFSHIPKFSGIEMQIMATPQITGARFTEYEMHIHPNGKTEGVIEEEFEQFLYVLEGTVELLCCGKMHNFVKGNYFWLPPHTAFSLHNKSDALCRAIWIRRRYEEVAGIQIPSPIIAHENDIIKLDVDTYKEQHLTPYEDIAFDMGINIQTFDPGIYFSFVESHIMEHGLYMTEGCGVYYLNKDYMEVAKGDFIYMAPYCSQFYYSTGWTKSQYLLYKDVNRDYVSFL